MTFARRRIDVTITLGEGQYGAQLGDTMTLTGYRVQAYISEMGGEAQGMAQVRIYGLPVDTLNRLTMTGPIANQMRAQNTILIAAGDDESALSTIYKGYMTDSWAEMQEAPNAALVIMGATGAVTAVKPVNASSYIGPTQASNIMSDLAAEAGFGFENHGVQVTLESPYFPGSTLAKIQACARAAGIYYTIRQGVLVIWPVGGSTSSDQIIISPKTNMVGYPTFSQQGVAVRCLLNPSVQFDKKFTIADSILTPANRSWNVWSIEHTLESQTPNGAWFTDIAGYWADE